MSSSTPLRFAALCFLSVAVMSGRLAQADEPSSAELPVKRIVLFNTGVGFFEHAGKIDGTQHVDLKFSTDEVNDLLKSMVLQDLGGGKVAAVTYDSREPITRTLKTFAIDLTNNPTLAGLLEQVRGERILVEAPQPIEGVILGVEHRKVAEGEVLVDKSFLNLKTSGGLRSVPIDGIVQSRLLNEKIAAELDEALSLLASAKGNDKKTVSLKFQGEGERDVRVGYIQEAPVWKASYRLVLSDKKEPFLQGWAIVENTGDHDWENVDLSLVSGRPISFIMDLYDPLFVSRPTVVPQEFANLTPRLHDQDLSLSLEVNKSRESKSGRGYAGGFGGMMGGAIMPAAPPAPARAADPAARPEPQEDRAEKEFGIDSGVAAAATGGEVGELFRYEISAPVTLARRKSAMLPIVNANVEGEKLSIYNASVQSKHPYNGFRLKNSTDVHLQQGPITVFDGGEFAGDARIEDVPPEGKRLISYAVDLDVEVAPSSSYRPAELASMNIAKGVLRWQNKLTRQHEFAIKNSAGQKKTVLVEQPIEGGWDLVSPKEPSEKTRSLYRFEVAVEPGKTETLTVKEQRLVGEQIVLTSFNTEAILAQAARAGKVAPEVAEALKKFAELKQNYDKVLAEQALVEEQIKSIEREQDRIRKNLPQLDRNSTLYNRYVKSLAEQEDQMQNLRAMQEKLREKAGEARRALDDYVSGLDI